MDDEKIKKADLIDGAYYRGQCRNANVARWFAKQNRFTHWRYKFGTRFLEDIDCEEDGAGHHYDIFYAYEKIDEPADEQDRIPKTEIDEVR